MPNLGPPELLIILLILVVLFGAKKLPDLARGTGRAMRIFKAETKGLHDDDEDTDTATTTTTTTATTVVPPTQIAPPVAQPTQPVAPVDPNANGATTPLPPTHVEK